MERRRFLSLLGLGIAGVALEQAVPLGRVWSFPKQIAIAPANQILTIEYITREYLEVLQRHLHLYALESRRFLYDEWQVGDKIKMRLPQRFYVRDSIPAPRPAFRPSSS